MQYDLFVVLREHGDVASDHLVHTLSYADDLVFVVEYWHA